MNTETESGIPGGQGRTGLGIELSGRSVLVTGAGISGRALIEPLRELGAEPVVTDRDPNSLARIAGLGVSTVSTEQLHATSELEQFGLVITSPGWRPSEPVLTAAVAAGVPVWGDVEFSWRVDRAQLYGPARQWLVVTGTNGKTTTTSMLQSMLQAGEIPSAACGNIGLPILDVLRGKANDLSAHPGVEVLAVELSSFQLHWAPSVRPMAGAVLNVAEDHLDWHGGMAAYAAAKARALSGRIAVVGLDDPVAAALGRRSKAGRTVGFRLGVPADGELGVVDNKLLDRAFNQAAILAEVADISPAGPAGVLDALAAGALARACGVAPQSVRDGLREHQVGPHRATLVAEIAGVSFVNDSKATNPHAAAVSLAAHERVVWLAGGLLKGAAVDELVAEATDRLAAVVLMGADAEQLRSALARHAPDVPVVTVAARDDTQMPEHPETIAGDAAMRRAVRTAAGFARAGDTVLLAPAGASFDMFRDYRHRGDSFAAAVTALGEAEIGTAL